MAKSAVAVAVSTEQQLLEVHKAPVVRLSSICQTYLNKNYENAKLDAGRNALPFPAFRLTGSQKAPWMVHINELARHIDNTNAKASESWTKSQL